LHHSSRGETRIEQAAKATWTLNRTTIGPRDLIAYGGSTPFTRKRSFHSSSVVGAKGNSANSLVIKSTSISTQDSVVETKTKKSVKSTLADIVVPRLNDLITHDMKYNNIVSRIISDPFFLVECYEAIRGKQGKMTKGVVKTTLVPSGRGNLFPRSVGNNKLPLGGGGATRRNKLRMI